MELWLNRIWQARWRVFLMKRAKLFLEINIIRNSPENGFTDYAWNNSLISNHCHISYRNQSFDLHCKSNGWFLYEMQHWAEMFNQPLHSTVVQNEDQPFVQNKEDQLFSSMEKSFPKFLKLWNEDMKIITDLFTITKGTFKEKPVFFSKF